MATLLISIYLINMMLFATQSFLNIKQTKQLEIKQIIINSKELNGLLVILYPLLIWVDGNCEVLCNAIEIIAVTVITILNLLFFQGHMTRLVILFVCSAIAAVLDYLYAHFLYAGDERIFVYMLLYLIVATFASYKEKKRVMKRW